MLPLAKAKPFRRIHLFLKTWKIENSGSESWPSCALKFVNGDRLQERDEAYVGSLEPGQQMNVSIEMKSPSTTGIYKSQWRLFTSAGIPFGDPIWFIASVEEGGLMGITQQLEQCHSLGGGLGINQNNNNHLIQSHNNHYSNAHNHSSSSSLIEQNNHQMNMSNPFQINKIHSLHTDGISNTHEWKNYPLVSVEEFSRTTNINHHEPLIPQAQQQQQNGSDNNSTIDDNSLDTY